MTAPNGLAKHYTALTDHERFRLSVMARARGDDAEFERITWTWGVWDRWQAAVTGTLILSVMLLQERCRFERAAGIGLVSDILLRLAVKVADQAWGDGYRVGAGREYNGPDLDLEAEANKAFAVLTESLAELTGEPAARMAGILAAVDDWAQSIGLDGETLGACFLPGGWAHLLPDGMGQPEPDPTWRAETAECLAESWQRHVRGGGR